MYILIENHYKKEKKGTVKSMKKYNKEEKKINFSKIKQKKKFKLQIKYKQQ